jgi:AraC-like DNA-binding protein
MAYLKPVRLTPAKNLLTDVENRSVYNLKNCELNIFETHTQAEQVHLTFHDLVITSMMRGKKVMHLPGIDSFEYFPGETVLAPAGTRMFIDFPDAHATDPTQCIALTLDRDTVTNTIGYMNEYFPRTNSGESWDINFQLTHLKNSDALASLMNKMVAVCTEKSITKDILADLTMKELIVRLVQLQYLEQLDIYDRPTATGPFRELVAYIRSNLHSKLDIDVLSRKACMSRAQLFRIFRREYGITPLQFIIRERLKTAKVLLTNTTHTIQQVSFEAGFDDVNNFIRIFKKCEGATPGSFRNRSIQIHD